MHTYTVYTFNNQNLDNYIVVLATSINNWYKLLSNFHDSPSQLSDDCGTRYENVKYTHVCVVVQINA